jgi:hypothetical protein
MLYLLFPTRNNTFPFFMALIFHSRKPFYESVAENNSCKGSIKGLMYPPLQYTSLQIKM